MDYNNKILTILKNTIMKTLEIVNSGNFQLDVNNEFGKFSPIRTEKWSNYIEDTYVGFIRVGMFDYVIDSESAKKINTNTLQVGDIVRLTTEPTVEIESILNQKSTSFQTQYE